MELSFEDLKLRNRKDIDGTPRLLRKGRKGREGSGHTWWVIVAGEEVAKWGGVRPGRKEQARGCGEGARGCGDGARGCGEGAWAGVGTGLGGGIGTGPGGAA